MLDQVDDVALLPDAVLALHVEHVDAELLVQHDDHEELQQQREEEVGHREAEVRERRRRVVEHRVLADRAHDADDQRRASPRAPARCPTSSKVFQVASPTMSATGRWVRNDVAPVALHEVAQPVHVLRGTRLVEVVLVLEVAQRLLRDAAAGAAARAAGRHAPTPARTPRSSRGATTTSAVSRRRTTKREHREFLAERSGATAAIAPDGRSAVKVQSSMFQVKPSWVGLSTTPLMVLRYPSWVGFWNSGITVTSLVASCWSAWL